MFTRVKKNRNPGNNPGIDPIITRLLLIFEDIYFLKKEYRKGRVGLKMFQFAEKLLKEQGIDRIIYNTKVHSDNSSLFEYLGYSFMDKVFTKLL